MPRDGGADFVSGGFRGHVQNRLRNVEQGVGVAEMLQHDAPNLILPVPIVPFPTRVSVVQVGYEY